MKNISYLVVILLLISCSDKNYNSELKDKIDHLIVKAERQGRDKVIEFPLDSLTDFEWDEAYMFLGNTGGIGLDYISKHIDARWSGPDVDDNHQRLIFLNNKEVVSYVDFDLNEESIWFDSCEFSPHDNQDIGAAVKRISREKDKMFITYLNCQNNRETRYFMPKHCLASRHEMLQPNCK
ncbi:hypothetical protein [uncultured Pontibacter sp.]|uniref:hypothetical protein n=1 Tax=uncultured Pontibacter sp. TaxID=453356 RepID=UPI002632304E|nr:hypothetical protein [uncultured Pontibacter sp.]